MGSTEKAVCMAWDAFAICIGKRPKHFTPREVLAWMAVVMKARALDENTTTEPRSSRADNGPSPSPQETKHVV